MFFKGFKFSSTGIAFLAEEIITTTDKIKKVVSTANNINAFFKTQK
jgi:hypothetical protein